MEAGTRADIEVIRYNPELKATWDEFVESSKNGTFLFNRDYMDYHSDRFIDCSLLFYRKGKLYSLLPANIKDGTLISHGGLTYGGLITTDKTTAEGTLEVFEAIKEFCSANSVGKIIYKPVPYIYHRLPSDEDLYSLFRYGAKLTGRNVSSVIDLNRHPRFNKDRREAVRRGERTGLEIRESQDWPIFWNILEENLKATYGATPVHSLDEIHRLKSSFQENIRLYGAYSGNEMKGGLVLYITPEAAHAQYISATPEGKKSGAVDCIVAYLTETGIRKINPGIRWFDLGTSNMDGGRVLNETLIYQKEGFGARAVCYDTWQVVL